MKTPRNKIEDSDIIFDDDFLDRLSQDRPIGCRSIQLSEKENVATVRSLTWPGCFAYHKLNTSLYGNVYIGDGVKNVDLAFMIQ